MKVIYVVLVCLLAFTSCAETEYAENGVDKKNITGYTEVGFYSLDGICTFTEQEQLQAAINPKRLTYRLQNSDQSKYIHVKFDGKPTAVGQKIKTEFSFQGVSFLNIAEVPGPSCRTSRHIGIFFMSEHSVRPETLV